MKKMILMASLLVFSVNMQGMEKPSYDGLQKKLLKQPSQVGQDSRVVFFEPKPLLTAGTNHATSGLVSVCLGRNLKQFPSYITIDRKEALYFDPNKIINTPAKKGANVYSRVALPGLEAFTNTNINYVDDSGRVNSCHILPYTWALVQQLHAGNINDSKRALSWYPENARSAVVGAINVVGSAQCKESIKTILDSELTLLGYKIDKDRLKKQVEEAATHVKEVLQLELNKARKAAANFLVKAKISFDEKISGSYGFLMGLPLGAILMYYFFIRNK